MEALVPYACRSKIGLEANANPLKLPCKLFRCLHPWTLHSFRRSEPWCSILLI